MPGMATHEARIRRWTRIEYEKLIDPGILRPGDAVELIDGEPIVSEPQGAAHCTAILRRPGSSMGASLVLISLLVGGCATGTASPPSSAAGASKSSSAIKRCSPSDPDRQAWFCVIGQILYGVAGAMQPDGGYSLR